MKKRAKKRSANGGWRIRLPRWRWPSLLLPYRRHITIGLVVTGVLAGVTLTYLYVSYSRIIEARLHGERDRAVPRVFARPLTLQTGQNLTQAELVARLNDVGYAQRSRVERTGEFAIERNTIVILSRGGDQAGKAVTVAFPEPPVVRKKSAKPPPPPPPARIATIRVAGKSLDRVVLDAPLLTALMTGSREKRRRVALESIPARMQEAVLAIEDRRFYYHPGLDPIRIVGAMLTNVFGDRPYLVGGSTITQQLSRNFFLTEQMVVEQQTRQRSWRRKILEQCMAVILETRATKDEILELYLNDVYLGHRGSFALHGVAEASKIYFGKDVRNLTLSEAALIAGIIQSPSNHSPFNNPERARDRRNVVLNAMVDGGYITGDAAERAKQEPIAVVARAVDNEAPYFVDYIGDVLDTGFPGIVAKPGALDIYTTLDLNLQRYAQDAVREGIAAVDKTLARRKRGQRNAQAALVALDPRSGEILAFIGGRSYNQSQFNRAISARRQIGSTFKPFVYLAAFEKAADDGAGDITPATLVRDEPTTWSYDDQEWTPRNYDGEYDGPITLRRALAMSRNVAAVKVAEQTGYDRVVSLWKRAKIGETDQVRPYPSVALGIVELTPLELAEAYTVFPGFGTIRKPRAIISVSSGEESVKPKAERGTEVARATAAFLVTHMMRSVINEGTGAAVRGAGFAPDAAGKTGTTNDLRDAWFVGFTPELLTVVWVGLDDNKPLGLSGSQAALPIWTAFMKDALAGRTSPPFSVPDGVSFVEIDRDTGQMATPTCPRMTNEAFLAGTEPLVACELHRFQ